MLEFSVATLSHPTVLIRNALILDGTGTEGFRGDILLRDGRIARMGDCRAESAALVVDADGLYASPGFIDPHGHSDLTLLADARGLSKLSQGITTEACGQCGMTPFPVPESDLPEFRGSLSYIWAPVDLTWRDTAGYLRALAAEPRGVNLCPFLGANTVALVAATEGRTEPEEVYVEPDELRGLWGITFGLGYEPLSQWPTEALLALGRAAAGKMIELHLRNEGGGLLESIEEALLLSRIPGVHVEIAHLKAAMDSNWGKMSSALARIEEANRAGVRIGFNAYPYTAGSTFLASTLPSWILGKGHAQALAMLREPEMRARLREEHAQGKSFYSLPPERVLVAQVSKEKWKWSEGLSLAQMAERLGASPFDAAVDLLLGNEGQVTSIFFTMCEEDVRQALAHPLGSICTDGLAYCPDGPTAAGKPHPRCYGAFPRFLGRYVRDTGLLPWPEAVRKCTSLPASRLGLHDRGLLREGYAADVVLFDPESIIDMADYSAPHRLPAGVQYVFVNGTMSVAGGKFSGDLGGRPLDPLE
ncbi:MAG: amidohydrolase family protein [Armatimonadota bacterium]